jgi:DNA polymerase-4
LSAGALQALRLCPELVIVRGHHRQYGEISDALYQRMKEISPLVEKASIDEMYMDFTGTEIMYGGDLPAYMYTLQKLVWDEFQLPCTISLSPNKLVSKIAANTVKPNGVINVPHDSERTFLAPLPIRVIPGVGRKTEELLQSKGFRLVSDIQQTPQAEFLKLLGKHGVWIYDAANGKGSTHISAGHVRKSISREQTFGSDKGDIRELERILKDLTTDVCSTLRRKNFRAKKVSVKIRYSDFSTITRDKSIEETNNDIDIFRAASMLLTQHFTTGRKLRLIGVKLSSLIQVEQLELDLFGKGHKDEQFFLKIIFTPTESSAYVSPSRSGACTAKQDFRDSRRL